jgi:hypothetical protein
MHKKPFLGIGTGMHAAVEYFARNVCGIPHPVPSKEGFLSPVIQRREMPEGGGGAREIYTPPFGIKGSRNREA